MLQVAGVAWTFDVARERLALAFFLQAFDAGPEILLPGLSWAKERLEELAGRARAWLDEPAASFDEAQERFQT